MTNVVNIREGTETAQFLELIRQGAGPLNAAYAVEWTPAKLRKQMRNHEFAELVAVAQERRLEGIEQRMYEVAERGNVRAMETILFCHAAHRGWRPPASRVDISHTSKIEVSLVSAAVEAARQLIATADPRALQPGGALDTIIDADAT